MAGRIPPGISKGTVEPCRLSTLAGQDRYLLPQPRAQIPEGRPDVRPSAGIRRAKGEASTHAAYRHSSILNPYMHRLLTWHAPCHGKCPCCPRRFPCSPRSSPLTHSSLPFSLPCPRWSCFKWAPRATSSSAPQSCACFPSSTSPPSFTGWTSRPSTSPWVRSFAASCGTSQVRRGKGQKGHAAHAQGFHRIRRMLGHRKHGWGGHMALQILTTM